jgi:hypothetical protein
VCVCVCVCVTFVMTFASVTNIKRKVEQNLNSSHTTEASHFYWEINMETRIKKLLRHLVFLLIPIIKYKLIKTCLKRN